MTDELEGYKVLMEVINVSPIEGESDSFWKLYINIDLD
jgi:hypothetical protein